MATASAAGVAAKGRPGLAAGALFGVAALALLYLLFLYQLFSDASLRAIGFTGLAEIRNISFLVLALLLIVMVVIWMRWVPVQATPVALAGGAGAPAGAAPGSPKGQVRVAELDPASRPGAPPSWRVPAVPPDVLQGGWKRYRFPAERTGGVCIDTDVVVDEGSPAAQGGDTTARGRTILRVRDEVARVCVRCDLMAHCHGKVAALITRQEMQGNHECVPGLKRIATQKIEAMRAPAPAAPAEDASAPDAAMDSTAELAEPLPGAPAPGAEGAAEPPYADPAPEPKSD